MVSLWSIAATLCLSGCGQGSSNALSVDVQGEMSDPTAASLNWSLLPGEDSLRLVTGWYDVVGPDQGVKRILDRDSAVYWLNPEPIVTARDIASFEMYQSSYDKSWGLAMKLNDEGAAVWRLATGQSIGGHLALVVNNKLLCAPEVMAEIPSGMTALNRGTYSKDELKAIMKVIQAEQ